MLVSSIARFNALNTMSNASFAAMQTNSSIMSTLNNIHTFGGEHDLSMLNSLDKKFSLDLQTNSLLYKLAYMQEKMAAKQQNNNKNSLNLLA